MLVAFMLLLAPVVYIQSFQIPAAAFSKRLRRHSPLYGNTYDEWRSDMTVDTLPLEEEFVQLCLDEMIDSDYGQQVFGIHDRTGTV